MPIAPIRITNGPWTGCFQSWDVSPSPTQELFTASNCVFRNTSAGLAAQIRPGFAKVTQLGTSSTQPLDTEGLSDLLTEAGVILTTDGVRTPQGLHEHIRLDGTYDPFLFVGGRMYRWNADPVSPVFTDITPLTTATIDTASRIFCVTFANKLIVTDGVNTPWQYDPATGAVALIQYDSIPSAWVAYGQPTIYGAKLFFIVKTIAGVSQRTSMVWSEENTPLVGYQQTNFANYWTLVQTSGDQLVALVGTNGGLYYFRENSIGLISGLVNSTFRTTATQDAVSLTVGTTSPGSVLKEGNFIWFLDRMGRPFRLRIGGQPEPLWKQMQVDVDASIAYGTYTTSQLERWGSAAWHQELGVVSFACWSTILGSGLPAAAVYIFDDTSGSFGGSWSFAAGERGNAIACQGLLRDVNARQRFVILGGDVADLTDNGGAVWMHNLLASGGGSYYLDNVTQLSSLIQSRMLSDDVSTEFIFDRLDVELAGDAGQTAFGQVVTLSTGTQRANTGAVQSLTTTTLRQGTGHAAFGLLERGRALRCTVQIATTPNTRIPEGFNRLLVTAYPDADDPGIP